MQYNWNKRQKSNALNRKNKITYSSISKNVVIINVLTGPGRGVLKVLWDGLRMARVPVTGVGRGCLAPPLGRGTEDFKINFWVSKCIFWCTIRLF